MQVLNDVRATEITFKNLKNTFSTSSVSNTGKQCIKQYS